MEENPRRLLATSGVLIGIFLGAIDATAVGTSMPTIIARLGGISIYFLVFSVFMVASLVAVPLFGRFSDQYGRKPFHLLAVAIFVGASMLCGLARTMAQLVIFRGLQGIGAGGLMAISFTMIADLYPLEQRAKIQGAISGAWGIASLVGPLAGGFITDRWGWPWVFFLNVPFGFLAVVLVQAGWKDSRRSGSSRPDVAGALFFSAAAAAFMSALAMVGRGRPTGTPVLFGIAAVFIGVLTWVERRVANPFISYDLFRIRLFATGALTGGFAATCLFGVTSYVPLFVQGVVGESPTRAGLVLVPMMIPWVICSGLSGFLLLRLGYKTLAVLGMALVAVGYLLLTRLGMEATWLTTAVPLLFVGGGLGLTIAPLLIAAQNAVPREKLGTSTSLTQFTRGLAGAVGVAVMGTFLSATLAARLPPIAGVKNADDIVDPLRRAGLDAAVRDLLREPLAAGLHKIFVVGAVAAVAGLLMALAIPGGKARDLAANQGK